MVCSQRLNHSCVCISTTLILSLMNHGFWDRKSQKGLSTSVFLTLPQVPLPVPKWSWNFRSFFSASLKSQQQQAAWTIPSLSTPNAGRSYHLCLWAFMPGLGQDVGGVRFYHWNKCSNLKREGAKSMLRHLGDSLFLPHVSLQFAENLTGVCVYRGLACLFSSADSSGWIEWHFDHPVATLIESTMLC